VKKYFSGHVLPNFKYLFNVKSRPYETRNSTGIRLVTSGLIPKMSKELEGNFPPGKAWKTYKNFQRFFAIMFLCRTFFFNFFFFKFLLNYFLWSFLWTVFNSSNFHFFHNFFPVTLDHTVYSSKGMFMYIFDAGKHEQIQLNIFIAKWHHKTIKYYFYQQPSSH